jgi:hypothetical protein
VERNHGGSAFFHPYYRSPLFCILSNKPVHYFHSRTLPSFKNEACCNHIQMLCKSRRIVVNAETLEGCQVEQLDCL